MWRNWHLSSLASPHIQRRAGSVFFFTGSGDITATSTTVQPSNITGSFQNQPTNSPVHSFINTVEFKCGHRVRSDSRTIIYNVKKFFDEKVRLEPIIVGDVVKITAEATGLSKNTVRRICSKGGVTGGSFGSPEKRMSRKKIVTDDFDRAAIRSFMHVRSIQQSKCYCRLFIKKESFKGKR